MFIRLFLSVSKATTTPVANKPIIEKTMVSISIRYLKFSI